MCFLRCHFHCCCCRCCCCHRHWLLRHWMRMWLRRPLQLGLDLRCARSPPTEGKCDRIKRTNGQQTRRRSLYSSQSSLQFAAVLTQKTPKSALEFRKEEEGQHERDEQCHSLLNRLAICICCRLSTPLVLSNRIWFGMESSLIESMLAA